jgi:hypothetical protein
MFPLLEFDGYSGRESEQRVVERIPGLNCLNDCIERWAVAACKWEWTNANETGKCVSCNTSETRRCRRINVTQAQ